MVQRNADMRHRVVQWDLQRFRDGTELYMGRGMYREYEDRLLLELLPEADFSDGAVCFFGTSSMKWALCDWEWNEVERAHIHNMAIGASNHQFTSDLIHFLIDDYDLLEAGPQKVHLVIGLFWSMATDPGEKGYFGSLWSRHGLYSYSKKEGIQHAINPGWARAFRSESARISSFLGGQFNRVARWVSTSIGINLAETSNISPEKARHWVNARYADLEWNETAESQIAELRELFDTLNHLDVRTTAVLLPTRNAYDQIGFVNIYHQNIERICQDTGIPLIDLSELLESDEFADMNHSNYAGRQRTNDRLMMIAEKHLIDIGVVESSSIEFPPQP